MYEMNLPEHWKVTTLGEIVTFTKKPRGLRYSEYSEIPFIPMELIPVAKLSSTEFILKTNNELKSGTYFEPGDILLPKITPSFENGKQCIIKELPTPFGIATTEVIPIREVKGVSDISYLFYYLLLPNVRISLAGKMQGTTGRQRLGKDTLVNFANTSPVTPRTTRHCPRLTDNPRSQSHSTTRDCLRARTQGNVDGFSLFTRHEK